jgi:hypothetical protein
MSTELYRKYIDIINENSQDHEQLNEGVVDSIKGSIPKIMKFLGMDTVKDIANAVKQVTGGNYSLNKDNIAKVSNALGTVKEGIAGNWQGKLLQFLHGSVILGGLALNDPSKAGAIIAVIALLVAGAFWGSESGQVGAMGKYGNKGFSTDKGPEDEV